MGLGVSQGLSVCVGSPPPTPPPTHPTNHPIKPNRLPGMARGCMLLQGHAPPAWTAHSQVNTSFSALMLADCREALGDAWGGCSKGAEARSRERGVTRTGNTNSSRTSHPCARTCSIPASKLLHAASGAVACAAEGNAAWASSVGEGVV